MQKCYLGPQALILLADAIKFMGALNDVNVAFNKIGAEGGIALRDALKTSYVKFVGIGKMYTTGEDGSAVTYSQLTPGVTLSTNGRSGEFLKFHDDSPSHIKLKWTDNGTESAWMELNSLDAVPLKLPLQSPFEGEHLDLSMQQLDPGHIMILSWWLTTEFSGAVAHLALGSNPIGDKAMIPLLDTLKDIPLISFDISKTNCGVSTASKLAELLTDETKFRGAINLLTLGSTGNMRDQKTYTLTAGEEKIDLSQKNLGSADVTLLTVWLQRPEVTAAVASMTLDDNKTIGATGADSLMESICTTRNTQIVKIKHDVGAL